MNTNKDKKPQPLVSFIIAVYNLPAEMVRACIDSLLALSLTQEEREIIVVDDGSMPAAIADLQDIAGEIVYIYQPNAGLSAARNRGIRMATGTYLQFVDGDDYLLKAPYEHCLDLARYRRPDIVMFKVGTSTDENLSLQDSTPVSGRDYLHGNNLRGTACGYLFRRSILGSLRFTPGILHEDEEFTPLLFLRAESVVDTRLTAYYYRERQQSITHGVDRKQVAKRMGDVRDTIFRLQDYAGRIPESDRVALNRRIAQLSMDYLYSVATLTHSAHQLRKAIESLRERHLFPLPANDYTRKYTLFRKAVNTRIGRAMLLILKN